MAYSEMKEASTNLNDQLHFNTSGNGQPRPSSSSLDESGGAGDQGVVDKSSVEQASPHPWPSTSKELDDTPKPKVKQGKRRKENDEIQQRILNLMENSNDEDEIDLAFAALSKHMKRSLNEEQQENLMDEINMLVSKHIKLARSGRVGIFRPSCNTVTTSAVAATVPVPVQIQTHSPTRPASVAHTTLPPPLQPIAQMHVDPYANNNTNNGYYEQSLSYQDL